MYLSMHRPDKYRDGGRCEADAIRLVVSVPTNVESILLVLLRRQLENDYFNAE